MSTTQKSDAYIIKRASEILGAVHHCGCKHCIDLLRESRNAGLPAQQTTTHSRTGADIPDGQSENDYSHN